ncbi:thiaminase II [Alicyclobacillus tolerans]|uniref:thiaminase II n=1 Tax=Alicyclobacillus tolerans TaxID=90970 RepID=UPI001F0108B6|nr:thiaminase II [Alicyclobacillus tolerans]MCF8567209.1 thiaminase II [Alicyclobacillus tolerans]
MKLSSLLREKADALWNMSFEHPFVKEIAAGTLPEDKFSHYVLNDSYYLTVFAQIQSIAASKSDDLDTIGRLAFHAQSTVTAEHALHETFFELLGVQRSANFTPAPTAYQYTSHLLSVAAAGSLAEIVAAILPCYWLYWEIGQKYKDSQPNHPIYDKWIATYQDEWFGELVNEQIHRLDNLGELATDAQKQRIERHFLISSQYEYKFWDMAYNKETWLFANP